MDSSRSSQRRPHEELLRELRVERQSESHGLNQLKERIVANQQRLPTQARILDISKKHIESGNLGFEGVLVP